MKQRHQATSSRWELLAKEMRERALVLDGHPEFTAKQLQGIKLKKLQAERQAKAEEIKKLYFNAGRWAGGARDHVAREAFQAMNERENNGA